MFQQDHFGALLREKKELRRHVFETRELIQELDAEICAAESSSSSSSSQDASLSQKETRLDELQKWLKHLNDSLTQNRLQGGSFSVLLDRNRKTLEVSPDGLIAITTAVYSLEPITPPDSSKSPFIRMEIAQPNDPEVMTANLVDNEIVFVMRTVEQLFMIENLLSIKPVEFNDFKRGVLMEWRVPRRKLVLASAEYEEIEETIGSILKKFNQKRILTMRKMEEVWNRKSVSFDPSDDSHEAKLLDLWRSLFPDTPLEERITNQWKELGFQGKDPATDFRGMGMLGLDCILYMAQHYTASAKKMLPSHRPYPWAVAGINMVATLLNEFFCLTSSSIQEPPTSEVWSKPLVILMNFCDHSNSFEEIFCAFMELLDGVFVAQKAGYMQFPDVMQTVKRIANEILASRLTSSDQLRARIEQRVMGLSSEASSPMISPLSSDSESNLSQSSALIPSSDDELIPLRPS